MSEWDKLSPLPGNALFGRDLADKAIRSKAHDLFDSGCAEVLELASGLELRTRSFVGRFALGDLIVTIRPKLPDAPFLSLLRYAYGLRDLNLQETTEYSSKHVSFQELLVLQLATEVRELLTRGIHREYERKEDDLLNPRGRIEFHRLAGIRYLSRATLPCAHYPRTEDTLVNQALLAGLMQAQKIARGSDLSTKLIRLIETLRQEVSVRRLDKLLIADAQASVDRRTTAYKSALRIVSLLFESQGVSLERNGSTVAAFGFLFNMNTFFQALISRFLHDHLEGFEVLDERSFERSFDYDSAKNPRKRKAPTTRPDFVIRHRGRIESILDAKYRDLWEKDLPSEMLYQLTVYACMQENGRRRAVILYPTMASDASDQDIYLRHPTSRTHFAQVVLRPVRLLQLDELLRLRNPSSRVRRMALAQEWAF
jgi:5-methylcytosine-specific restriction enzyme subunit McrC